MGSSQSLKLKLEHLFHSPGTEMGGVATFRVDQPCQAKELEITLVGTEKTSLKLPWVNKETTYRGNYEREFYRKTFVFSIGPIVPKGINPYKFSIPLKKDLPPTYFTGCPEQFEIVYELQAQIRTPSGIVKRAVTPIIRDRQVPFPSISSPVTCKDYPYCPYTVVLEKRKFVYGEEARAECIFEPNKRNYEIEKIEFSLIKTVSFI